MNAGSARQPWLGSLLLTTVVFGVDLCLPLGVASAVPYTFAVLLALKARQPWAGPAIAGLCIALTILKMLIHPERGTTELWKVIANRCLAIFAITMTTLLGILRRRADAARRQAEQRIREHEGELAHLGRLTLLGQIAAGLAHEINQPLAAISLQAEIAAAIARQSPAARPELLAALDEIVEQSGRAAQIIRSVRRLARRETPGADSIELNPLIDSVVELMDWQARRAGVEVRTELDPAVGAVLGDRTQLEQVVMNLIQNSIEALSAPGDRPRIVTIATASAGDMATITVRDTGPGFAAIERIFERFYTTKPTGMGLGLAISQAIIESHGGRIAAQAGVGATVCIHLPTYSGEGP